MLFILSQRSNYQNRINHINISEIIKKPERNVQNKPFVGMELQLSA